MGEKYKDPFTLFSVYFRRVDLEKNEPVFFVMLQSSIHHSKSHLFFGLR
ncbi:hypothetical protein C4J91_2166 [Pseudomonas sp. R3-52-08]|nr:hypothetical protein C4J91_2166 [Pseudomonas sp. R3-52-08]